MTRLAKLAVGSFLVLGTSSAVAQQASARRQDVVGTWMLISETAQKDGRTTEPLGPHPLGSMMLDGNGRFMLMIARPDLPKFAAKRREAGTPAENQAVLSGSLSFLGTYSVDEANGVLILHVEASTFPNWVGTDQRRDFTISGSEMKWVNRTPAIAAASAELVWRRAGSR